MGKNIHIVINKGSLICLFVWMTELVMATSAIFFSVTGNRHFLTSNNFF